MDGISTGWLTDEALQDYIHDFHQSLSKRQRRKTLAILQSELKDGEVLVGDYEVPDTPEKLTVVIRNLDDFCRFLDVLDERNDPIVVVSFRRVREEALEYTL